MFIKNLGPGTPYETKMCNEESFKEYDIYILNFKS